MIVVDVNVVAYYVIEGQKTALARELMQRELHLRTPEWSYARTGPGPLAAGD